MNAADRNAPTRWIDLEHARVPVWEHGSGPPVVFVHGWPLHGGTWDAVVAVLDGRCRSIVLDLPGAGESAWTDPARLSLSELAGAVEQVARAVSPDEPVVLVGHDSGGGLARWAAAALGDHVAGMVLGNTEIPGVHSWRFSLLLGAMQLPGAVATTRAAMKTRLGRHLLLRDCVHDRSHVSRLGDRFLAPLARDPHRLDGVLGVIDGVKASDFDAIGEAHPRIHAPVRLVWGTECLWFPLEGARQMCAEFGGRATLHEVPGAGLLVHEERPAEFAEQLLALVGELTPRRSAS